MSEFTLPLYILIEKGIPLTQAEIESEVLKTWQASPYSLNVAIKNDARFTRLVDGRITLTTYGLTIPKTKKETNGSRRDRIVAVLQTLGKPANYQQISKTHNQMFPDSPITPAAVRTLLASNRKFFILTEPKMYALLEWDP